MDTLPLFPLGTVMLPGILLPLRVFEPRYVAMMRAVEPVQAPFGLIGIRRGHEVGDPSPELYQVGVAGTVASMRRSPDHLSVEVRTGRRFHLDAVYEDRAPYLVGEVTWLKPEWDEGTDLGGGEHSGGDHSDDARSTRADLAELSIRAAEAFASFTHSVGARVDGLPVDDPYRLTAAILDGLGQPLPQLQEVLEAGDAARRLRTVIAMCRREQQLAEVLGCRAARVTPPSRLSPN